MIGHLLSVIGWLGFCAIFASIFIVPRYLKSRERQQMQETLRAAIERGQTLPTEMLDIMSRDAPRRISPRSDLRRGLLWLSIGAAFATFGWILGYSSDGSDFAYPMMGLAAFPAFIGVAFLIAAFFSREKTR